MFTPQQNHVKILMLEKLPTNFYIFMIMIAEDGLRMKSSLQRHHWCQCLEQSPLCLDNRSLAPCNR